MTWCTFDCYVCRTGILDFQFASNSECLVAIMASFSEGVLSSLEDAVHPAEFATGINHVFIAKKIKFDGRALRDILQDKCRHDDEGDENGGDEDEDGDDAKAKS